MPVKVRVSIAETGKVSGEAEDFNFAFVTKAPFEIFRHLEAFLRGVLKVWGSTPLGGE